MILPQTARFVAIMKYYISILLLLTLALPTLAAPIPNCKLVNLAFCDFPDIIF